MVSGPWGLAGVGCRVRSPPANGRTRAAAAGARASTGEAGWVPATGERGGGPRQGVAGGRGSVHGAGPGRRGRRRPMRPARGEEEKGGRRVARGHGRSSDAAGREEAGVAPVRGRATSAAEAARGVVAGVTGGGEDMQELVSELGKAQGGWRSSHRCGRDRQRARGGPMR